MINSCKTLRKERERYKQNLKILAHSKMIIIVLCCILVTFGETFVLSVDFCFFVCFSFVVFECVLSLL